MTAPPRCSVSCSLTLRGEARGSPYTAGRVPRVGRVVREPCHGQEDSARSTSGCPELVSHGQNGVRVPCQGCSRSQSTLLTLGTSWWEGRTRGPFWGLLLSGRDITHGCRRCSCCGSSQSLEGFVHGCTFTAFLGSHSICKAAVLHASCDVRKLLNKYCWLPAPPHVASNDWSLSRAAAAFGFGHTWIVQAPRPSPGRNPVGPH